MATSTVRDSHRYCRIVRIVRNIILSARTVRIVRVLISDCRTFVKKDEPDWPTSYVHFRGNDEGGAVNSRSFVAVRHSLRSRSGLLRMTGRDKIQQKWLPLTSILSPTRERRDIVWAIRWGGGGRLRPRPPSPPLHTPYPCDRGPCASDRLCEVSSSRGRSRRSRICIASPTGSSGR